MVECSKNSSCSKSICKQKFVVEKQVQFVRLKASFFVFKKSCLELFERKLKKKSFKNAFIKLHNRKMFENVF